MNAILISNISIPIHIDTNGNLYFEFKKKLFQLNVDKNDDPIFEEGNYEIISDQPTQLGEIVKSNYFGDEKYFPEDNCHSLKDEFSDNDSEDEEEYFTFYKSNKEIDFPIYERENGHILALYDIFIYHNEELIFQSKLKNGMCCYRVLLQTNGDFHFRPIGNTDEQYHLDLINDSIVCIKI